MEPASGEVIRLPGEFRRGSIVAEIELLPLDFEHLHRPAAHYVRQDRSDHTLQATALMNEACLLIIFNGEN